MRSDSAVFCDTFLIPETLGHRRSGQWTQAIVDDIDTAYGDNPGHSLKIVNACFSRGPIAL
jgi:hypothetical protein